MRAAVHRAVVELVQEVGADNVTIPAVARRAGVNPSSVYRRWGTPPALLADVADQRQDEEAPELLGDLREDLERAAVWTLTDLSRPGGVAFFRAEVAPDVDERRAGLRACLERVSARFQAPLAAAAERGEPVPALERVLDRVVAPSTSASCSRSRERTNSTHGTWSPSCAPPAGTPLRATAATADLGLRWPKYRTCAIC